MNIVFEYIYILQFNQIENLYFLFTFFISSYNNNNVFV